MRRPRSKLEVSTFPFLAVLLCAMGSLMLFLFIMDRRAKIVERNRALAARESYAASRLAQTQAERDARKAEWEKAQDKLRALLLEQQQQLLAQSEGIQEELTNANQKLQIVRSQYLSAQEAIQGETGRIFLLQSEVDKERDSVKKVEKKESANKAELAKATQELLELTAALELLKTQKSQDKDVYSVVPYRGKRGDMRPPIYVECVRNGLVFHPEKKLLRTGFFTAQAIITEVERFAGPLAAEKLTKQRDIIPEAEKKGPYVLFLVRPDGIANYYQAQAALRGVDIDFGYELVDEQWVLDFSSAAAPNLPDSPPAPFPPAQPGIRVPGLRGRVGGVAGNGSGADFPSSLAGGNPDGAVSPGANGPTSPNPNRLSGIPGGNGLGAPYASGNQNPGTGSVGSGSGSPSAIGASNGIVGGMGGGSAWPSANGSQGTGFGPGGTGTGGNSTWPSANGSQGTGFGSGGATNGANGSGWPSVGGSQGTGFGPGGTGTGGNSTWPSANGSQGPGFGSGGATNGANGSDWPSANGSQGTGFGPGGTRSSGNPTWPSANGSQGTGFGSGGATSGAGGSVGGAQGTGFGSGGSGGSPSPFAGGSPGTAGPTGMGLVSSFTPVTQPGSGGQGGGGGVSMPGGAGLGSPYSGPGSPASTGVAGLTPQDTSIVPLANVGFGPPGSPVATSSLRPDVIASSGSSGATGGGPYATGPGGTNGPPGATGGGSFSPGTIGAYGAAGAGGSSFSPGGNGASGGGSYSPGSGGTNGPPGDAGPPSAGSSGSQGAGGAPSSGGGGIPSFSFGASPGQGGGGSPQNINPNVTPDQSTDGGSAGQAGQSAGISLGSSAGQGSSGGSSGGPSLPSAPLPAAFNTTPTKTTASAPPTLSRVLGNKDFQITIDCYVDHVNVYPGGMQFRWTPQNQAAMDQALVQSVTRLIERRQASVRPGEPPYRPLVRFQVLPDGLRSYYHVYPLLERLRIPMTRENVEE